MYKIKNTDSSIHTIEKYHNFGEKKLKIFLRKIGEFGMHYYKNNITYFLRK